MACCLGLLACYLFKYVAQLKHCANATRLFSAGKAILNISVQCRIMDGIEHDLCWSLRHSTLHQDIYILKPTVFLPGLEILPCRKMNFFIFQFGSVTVPGIYLHPESLPRKLLVAFLTTASSISPLFLETCKTNQPNKQKKATN